MYYTDNPINDWNNNFTEQERELLKRPICIECGQHITDDFCYEVGGGYICESCMDSYYKVETPVED